MNGPEVPFDWEAAAAEAGIQQGQQALGERLFGPGSAEQRLASTDGAARAAEEEKTVYEVADFSSLIQHNTTGWQLQDIFATPTVQHTSPPASSDDIDDEQLFHVTAKSNALQALREANLLAQDQIDEVTTKVADLQVDAKSSLLTRLMGKISPSLLGLPPAGAALKKKLSTKKLFTSASRISERPATKASSMTAVRKAQASACKQLGLISREEDFTDDILQQYLQIFQQPLSAQQVQGLAELAEVSSRPAFRLPEDEMRSMLKEAPYAD
jgi:hypothetical protein